MNSCKKHKISYLGEFVDKDIEKEFFNYDMGQAEKYIKPMILFLGILNTLFLIPDYFLIKNIKIYEAILANRIIFLILVIALYFLVDKIKDYSMLALCVTFYEIIAAISFLIIYYQYSNPNYLIQAFGVIVIILAIYLVPNKWKYTLFASAFICSSFILLSIYFIKNKNLFEFAAGIVYTLIVLMLCAIASYRTNFQKRKQYVDSVELVRISITDPLTGIYNRNKLNEELKRWIEFCKRYKETFSLIIFDFDDFKKVNDNYGHLFGDIVIMDIVNIIKNAIRQTDIFARWGGEEFVLLLPKTDLNQALILTERLRILICNKIFENDLKITCSFGLGAYKKEEDIDTLLNRVDKLLYEAKRAGKNTIVFDNAEI